MLLPLPLQNNIAGTGMARQLRKKSETGVYHVMLRGINRQDIFEDEGDYQQMVSILRGLIDRCDEHKVQLPSLCTFYAYCLMSNHVHLLIQEREENISDVVITRTDPMIFAPNPFPLRRTRFFSVCSVIFIIEPFI